MFSFCFKICLVKVMLHVDANVFTTVPTALTEQFSKTSLSNDI